MKAMRLSISAQEILNEFKYYQANKTAVLLWQNVLGKRVKVSALVFDADIGTDIRFLSLGQNMPFATDLPIYIYGEHKTFVFKSTIKYISSAELTISLPRMVRFEEMRSIKRFDISSVKNCLVTMKRLNSKEENEFIYKLNDISNTGISFFMGKDAPLKPGHQVRITHIQNDQIFYDLNGKIVHISPIINSKGLIDVMQTKVGVKFIDQFRLKDLTIYKKFIKEMN